MPRRVRKGARRIGDPCRMPCKVRKEVWLEPRRVRIRKNENYPPLFKKKSKISGGDICAKHRKAPKVFFLFLAPAGKL